MNPRALNLPKTFDEVDFKDLVKLSLVVLLLAVIGVQFWWFTKQRDTEKKYEPVIEVLDELAKALGTNARFRNGRWVEWV
jgi:predicted MPP superfamily phosphohydrolase